MCLLVYALSTTAQAAVGIFIYRQSAAHPEGNSTVMEYNSFKRWESVTEFRTANGRVKVTKFQPLQILPYRNAQPPGAVIRTSSAEFWRQEYLVYVSAHNTYPRSRVYLVKQVTQLKKVVEELAAGNAWFEGEWIKDAKVDNIIAERKRDKIKAANSKKVGEYNKKVEKIISGKKEELASIERQVDDLSYEIKAEEKKIKKLNDGAERDSSSFNAEIMELLKKIK